MKMKVLALAFLLVSSMTFAQKGEIRDAEDAVEDSQFQEAQQLLKSVETAIPSMKDKWQARYYLAKGQAYLGLNKKEGTTEGLKTAAESFKKAIELGEEDAKRGLANTQSAVINSGIKNRQAKNYKEAYKQFHLAYQLSPKDTLYLFAAANTAISASDNEQAIKWYEKLKDLGYTGIKTEYTAVKKETGEVQVFNTKNERDIYVKTGQYIKPDKQITKSRSGDIVRQLAFLYLNKDQKDKALEAIKEAKKVNPHDIQILKAEALIYQKMGQTEKYTELLKNLIKEDPENAARFYSMLGHGAMDADSLDLAAKYFKKGIEANPEMSELYRGMANVYIKKQTGIFKEMGTLGLSDADTKKYNALAKKRKELLKKALPYLEKALKYEPDNENISRTLYQLYKQLGNEKKAQEYKPTTTK